MRARSILVLTLLSLANLLVSQERAGLMLGQYNGINALSLNPAFSFNSANNWDIQLIGAHLFAETNYAHISGANPFQLLRNNQNIFVPKSRSDITAEPNDKIIVFTESGNTRGEITADILGPGFLLKLGERHTIGLSTKGRSLASSFDIPSIANYFAHENFEVGPTYMFPEMEAGSMAWLEINGHYGYALNDKINVGASAKYLRGFFASFIQNNTTFDFEELAEDEYDIVTGGSFTLGYPNQANTFGPSGTGVAFDLGVTIKDVLREGTTLGLSILDLGSIRFSGTKETYNFNTELVLESTSYEDLENLDSLQNQLRRDFELGSSSSGNYSMSLPTALSAQFSTPITDHFSVAGYWTQRIKIMPASYNTSRGNSLNVTPMYERLVSLVSDNLLGQMCMLIFRFILLSSGREIKGVIRKCSVIGR